MNLHFAFIVALAMTTIRWTLFATALFCAVFIPVHGHILGVQSRYTVYFNAAKNKGVFRCLDGSATIPFSSVNNDICDCGDGSDEPGTAACTALRGSALTLFPRDWKFQCTGDEHVSQAFLHNSVNDGICDCCDGSDETESPTLCPNRCAEVARELVRQREAEQERSRKAAEGKAVMHSAALRRREEAAKSLAELEPEYAQIVADLPALEARKAAAEKEQEALWAELGMKQDESEAGLYESEFSDEATSCIRWCETGGCIGTGPRESHRDKSCSNVIDRDSSGYCECKTNDKKDEPEDDEEDVEPEAEGEGTEVRRGTVTYRFSSGHPRFTCMYVCDHSGEAGVDQQPEKLESFTILGELREASKSLERKKNRLEEVKGAMEAAKKLLSSPTITTEDLLRTLEKEEFTIDFQEYTYAIVMFDTVYQRDMGMTTGGNLLGLWKSFAENTYSVWAKDAHDLTQMIYDNGLKCWNGVVRNVEVHLVCGPENKLMTVEEPSMCNYRMVFETPAMCDD